MVAARFFAISRRSLRVPQSTILRTRMNSSTATANPIPATFMRGGTSKGIFLKREDLPADQTAWDDIFLGIMGSPDAKYGRQLNGMGGGVSSLSKIMVVGPPTTQELKDRGVQCEYTFAQVGIRDEQVDYSGNCGNLTAVVGVFAVDETIVVVGNTKTPHSDGAKNDPRARAAEATVRCYNTNTRKIVDTTFPVSPSGKPLLDLPETTIAGVPHAGSRIVCDFTNPAGAATGRLLPTSHPTDTLLVSIPINSGAAQEIEVIASLVDATNPTVFVRLADLQKAALPMDTYLAGEKNAVALVTPVLEALRQAGAVKMGLDPDAQAQPKIALLSAPTDAEGEGADGVDIVVHALSMGVLHKAVPMTVGLCLGVAARTRGTIAWEIVQQRAGKQREAGDTGMVRLRHPGGLVDVGAEFGASGGEGAGGGEREVKSAKVVRTGRRLMKGVVWH